MLLLTATTFAAASGIHYQTPMLGAMAAEFGVDGAAIGWIPTLTFGGFLCGIVFLVPLGDRLDKRRLILENRMYQEQLEQRVQEQARRIEELSLERLQALVHALEEKDPYLRGHSVRVANYAFGIGRELGLAPAALDLISLGAELHDLGKIGVSEAVLHKPGKLTDIEYRHIMEHPVTGARILGPLMRDAPAALAIVRSHHERMDGKGFPDGLKGEEIPLEVRIVTVADSFDAMTSLRPYRPALSVPKAMVELEDGKGMQFDPGAVQAFLRAFPDAASLPVATPEVRPLHLPTPVAVRRA